MKQVVYYKVVRAGGCGGPARSAFVKNKAAVEYREMSFVSAPKWLADNGYHLTVFANLREAQRFANYRRSYRREVYRCFVRGVKDTLPVFLSTKAIERGEVVEANKALFPAGTVMAEEVMIFGSPVYTKW